MKINYIIFFLLISTAMFSQQEDAWVYFNAKPSAQTYFDTPLLMLSQRALDRRTNQNIALDFTDVPLETTYVNQIKAISGITVMAQSKWFNALHIRGSQTNILALRSFSFVRNVDFANKSLNVRSIRTSKKQVFKKNDKFSAVKVDYAYGNSSNQIQMLNGQVLHQQNYTGTGKIIAVMDGGFPNVNTAEPFQRLLNNNQILGGYDFVSRNNNFYVGNEHGTLVLSTMGGYKESQLIGTAPDAFYYLFITEDVTSENPVEESLFVEAAEEADRLGVDIISASVGYFYYDNTNYSHTYGDMTGNVNFISKGAEMAFSKGIIVVAAAGNEGQTAEPHIAAPADAVSVITVGSVTGSKVKSSFSSIGPSFDGRIKPDVMAQGSLAVVSDTEGNIVVNNGTSFSCPIMSGMIACLWQAFPTKTNKEIRQMILRSSDKFSNPDNNYGYGIPNFGSALGVEGFKEADFSLYPNPAKTIITFDFPNEINSASVIVYSILGQKVIEKEITSQNPVLSVQNLKSGLYFYILDANGIHKTGKIIKE